MTSRAPPATRAILEQPLLGCVDARPHAAPYIVTTDPPVKGSAFETATRRWTGSSVGRVPVRVPQSAGDGHGGFDSGIGAAVVARFRKAGCEGRVSATLIGTDRSVSLGGDDSFVAASVFKVAVALAALVAGEEGRVDLSAPVTLLPGQCRGSRRGGRAGACWEWFATKWG